MAKNKFLRYHYNVYFPENISEMCLTFFNNLDDNISPTYHAMHQMVDDPHGIIDLPTKEDLMNPENILVEIYENLNNGSRTDDIQKALIRVKHLSDKKDFSYLVAKEGFIVSAWSNDKNDIHKLTNNNGYYRGNNGKNNPTNKSFLDNKK